MNSMSFERAEKLEYPVTGIESSRALLEDFARRERPSNATLLNFAGTGGKFISKAGGPAGQFEQMINGILPYGIAILFMGFG